MNFNEDLAAVHGYLCADGYVIKNPATQKHKYYYIGLRNTNKILLKDFQGKFRNVFGVTPIITNEGRCKIQSKKIFGQLTRGYSYYSYEWRMPELPGVMLRSWLRAYFDCEGWVELQKGKNRAVRADCVNMSGLEQVRNALARIGINSSIRKRNRPIWRISICGRDDLEKFKNYVGFLHPQKSALLDAAILSYKDYTWVIPDGRKKLLEFINEKGRKNVKRKEIRFFSIEKKNLDVLEDKLTKHGIACKKYGPWKNRRGTFYYCLSIKTW